MVEPMEIVQLPNNSDTSVTLSLKPQIHSSQIHSDKTEEEDAKFTDNNTSPTSLKDSSKETKSGYTSRLRPRKITNYRDQFDISCSQQSEQESLDENNSNYAYGNCILPDNIDELREIINKCDTDLKTLEDNFFMEEHKDESIFLFTTQLNSISAKKSIS